MALDLLYNPGEYFSAHGDLIFTLLEDTKPFSSTTYPDYRYVCDIYIGGIQQARLKAHPRPYDKIGIFNIGNIVRNYINNILQPVSFNLRAQKFGETEFYVNVICRFGEEYGGVTYTNIIIDSQRSYFNHYNDRLIPAATILSSYVDKALTVRPYAVDVNRTARFCFIPFLPSDDTAINLIINTYNGAGLISTTTQPVTPTADSSNELQLFNVSPSAINATVPGFINDYIEYYTVEFNTTNIIDDSIYRFNLYCENKHEIITVHFLNRFGGYETKDFSKVSRTTIEFEKNDFGISNTYIAPTTGQVFYEGFNVYNESRRVYAGSYKEKMVLNTDLLRDQEYLWLRDLVVSPYILIERAGYLIPIIIKDTNYEYKKNVNDDLTNLTINIEFGDRFNTQYR